MDHHRQAFRIRLLQGVLAVALLLLDAPLTFGEGGASPPGTVAAAAPLAQTVARWQWLKDTYWYVPTAYLPALLFDAERQELRTVPDQTVYHITDYRGGYFWGPTVVKLGSAPVTCLSLVGSVTPEGDILLTFTPVEPGDDATVTQGFGRMRRKLGQWMMENQMSSGAGPRLQVSHWAYMAQGRPHQRNWKSLPGVGMSIPDFLAQCPGGPEVVGAGGRPD